MASPTGADCAALLLDTIPPLMRALRREASEGNAAELSVLQFRTLSYLSRNDGAALGEIAGTFDLSPPTLSKTVDGLVRRGLVRRASPDEDRRRLSLSLTREGRDLTAQVRRRIQGRLAVRFDELSAAQRSTVHEALQALTEVFATPKATA